MRILFMGRKDVSTACLEWLVAKGHSISGVMTDHHLTGSPTAAYAKANNLPLMTLEEARGAVKDGKLSFDLAVSVVYWRIIPVDLIDAAPLGIINFHPAPLPDFKGTAGYNVAILEELTHWAVTAHYIDSGVDTGPIIDIDSFPIDVEKETAKSLEAKSMSRLVEQFKRVVDSVDAAGGQLQTTPNVGGRHFSRRDMEDMKYVREGDDVDRKIRAFWFPPYSGATIEIDGKPYTLVNQQILGSLTKDTSSTSSLSAPSSEA